jgi:hypothetical protein
VALAGLLVLLYLHVTTPWVRQHDVGAHREYIEYLSTHKALPPVLQGWETWQPPLYYVAAALWRALFSAFPFDDPFRPVQYLATVLYLTAILAAVRIFRQLNLNAVERVGALCLLAVLPANLFLAARINNDVFLPLLGAGVMFVTAEFIRTGTRRWLWWLAFLLPAALATKGSSLAIAAGSLALVLWAELRCSGWWPALRHTCLTALPAAIWELACSLRTLAQTGNPLYVNARLLPDELRVHAPACSRFLSFDFAAFLGGAVYYDQPVRQSYPTALLTSLVYGEYGMHEHTFHWPELLRWGCLGLVLLLAAGALVAPRAELRPVWITCLVLAGCQALLAVVYAVQFAYACNQDMRFYAQAFIPLSCLCGLGIGHFWQEAGWIGRGVVLVVAVALLLGLADFYLALLF